MTPNWQEPETKTELEYELETIEEDSSKSKIIYGYILGNEGDLI
jgi:hypothetical protein